MNRKLALTTFFVILAGLAAGYALGYAYFRGVRDARDGLVRIKVRGGVEYLSFGRQTETSEN